MSGAQTAAVIARLAAAFPHRPVEQRTIEVYVDALSDLDTAGLDRVARHHMATGEWFPTIGALRRSYFEALLDLPTPLEAWAQVEHTVRVGGAPDDIPDPTARELARQIGWNTIRLSEKPDIVRAQFTKAYEQARADLIDRANTSSLRIAARGSLGPSRASRAEIAARTPSPARGA